MSFSDLAGQERAVEQLRRSLQRSRLAHAYLFIGPHDSDTEVVARTLAKALNCREETGDACDRCDPCRRVDNGSHPDVHWVRPESKSRRIQIKQIREFEGEVRLKPGMARIKVGVIVDADCMTEEAGNAFLKTLEEPPDQTIIVLLTSEPQRLLPTILSRCLRMSFGPTSAASESPHRKTVVEMLTDFTGGVAGAYQLLDGITSMLRKLREEISTRAESEANVDRYEELDPKARERLEDEMEARIEGEYRGERERVLEEIYSWMLDLLLCVVGADDNLLEHSGQAEVLRRSAAGLPVADALRNLEAVERIRDALARNVTETLALEVGLLNFTGAHALARSKGAR
jgi:DNA polymerase-3 subunit delta'